MIDKLKFFKNVTEETFVVDAFLENHKEYGRTKYIDEDEDLCDVLPSEWINNDFDHCDYSDCDDYYRKDGKYSIRSLSYDELLEEMVKDDDFFKIAFESAASENMEKLIDEYFIDLEEGDIIFPNKLAYADLYKQYMPKGNGVFKLEWTYPKDDIDYIEFKKEKDGTWKKTEYYLCDLYKKIMNELGYDDI